MSRPQKIEVWWDDTTEDPNWQDADEIRDADTTLCRTVGYVIGVRDRRLILSGTVAPDGSGNSTRIPLGCITRIAQLRAEKRISIDDLWGCIEAGARTPDGRPRRGTRRS